MQNRISHVSGTEKIRTRSGRAADHEYPSARSGMKSVLEERAQIEETADLRVTVKLFDHAGCESCPGTARNESSPAGTSPVAPRVAPPCHQRVNPFLCAKVKLVPRHLNPLETYHRSDTAMPVPLPSTSTHYTDPRLISPAKSDGRYTYERAAYTISRAYVPCWLETGRPSRCLSFASRCTCCTRSPTRPEGYLQSRKRITREFRSGTWLRRECNDTRVHAGATRSPIPGAQV